MDYQSLYARTVVELRKLARDMGVRVPAGAKKQLLVELLLEADARQEAERRTARQKGAPTPPEGDAEKTAANAESPAPKATAADNAASPAIKDAQKPEGAGAQAAGNAPKPAPRKRGRPSKAELAARDAAEAQTASAGRSDGDARVKRSPGPVKSAKAAAPAAPGEPVSKGVATESVSPRDARRSAEGGRAVPDTAVPSRQGQGKPAAAEAVPGRPEVEGARLPSAAKADESQPGGSSAARPQAAGKENAPEARAAAADRPGQGGADDAGSEPRPRPSAYRDSTDRQARQGYGGRSGYGEARAEQRRGGGNPQRQGAPRFVSGGTPAGREAVPHPRHGLSGEGVNRNRPTPHQEGADARQRPAQEGFVRPGQLAHHVEPRAEGQEPRQRFAQEGGVRPAPEGNEARAAAVAQNAAPRGPETVAGEGESRQRREGYYNAEYRTSNPAVPELLAAGECGEGAGVLEIQPDGYGFLRAENCQKGPNDVYISIAQIRRFNLRQGDYVEGRTRPQREGDRYSAILYITKVNGEDPERAAARPRFEDLVPIYPDRRIRLERPGNEDLSLRLVDMLAPIGKGQRGMIVSPPKAGKTTLLKKIANAITANNPEIHLIVLLIDERPEEVTDMKRSIDGEVVYSTFDQPPENHAQVSEMVLERAQRLVEMGKDVVVLMDSITRLARAYNLVIAPTGRSLSGGLDPGALFKPKRFFGAARNIENGGSLTIIATALIETGSRMDDIIFEEFKGTGNMELHLDRKLSDRRVFPAIDMVRSGTRREELLLTEAEQAGALRVRRMLGNGRDQEMTEQIIGVMARTRNNADFFERLKGWEAVAEKEGYTLGKG